jgi:hypothetical protein
MKHSIFAIELCMRLEPGSSLRSELRQIVVDHPAVTGPHAKWEMLQAATGLLLSGQQLFERGCWDFFDDDARAQRDYDMWTKGLTTEEGSRQGPSGGVDPYRSEPRYMTFTISLLLQKDTLGERQVAALCNMPDPVLWRRSTFVRILSGLGVVNYAFVKSDVFYLIPGEESWGLTLADLQDPKFEYLRAIESDF